MRLTVAEQSLLEDWLWCFQSPDCVLSEHSFDSNQSAFADDLKRLLKKNPRSVLENMHSILSHCRTGRLGERFESIWYSIFDLHPNYQILVYHYPVLWHKQTLGEMDFIVKNVSTEQKLHLELACKFYLQVNTANKEVIWLGPGLQDRLDKKLVHLSEHQLSWPHRTEIRDQLPLECHSNFRSHALVKGRFFIDLKSLMLPIALASEENTNEFSQTTPINECKTWGEKLRYYYRNLPFKAVVQNGQWTQNSEAELGVWGDDYWIKNAFKLCDWQWQIVQKTDWLALKKAKNFKDTLQSLEKLLQQPISFPVQCVAFNGNGQEMMRVFRVPESWRSRAEQSFA